MISQRLNIIFNNAIKKANELQHEFLTLEGILWALLEDEQVVNVMNECGGDIEGIKKELNDFLLNKNNFSVISSEDIENLSQSQFDDEKIKDLAEESGIRYQPEISMALQRVIQRAALHVRSSNKEKIRGINLLIAMFPEKESFAIYLLEKQGIRKFDVIKRIAHSLDRPTNTEDEYEVEVGEGPSTAPKKEKSPLRDFAINLNEMAEKGKIDPIIGRVSELKRIFQILCRRRKNNPILVGEAGVGKTALAEGLAWSIINKKVPSFLEDSTVYALDLGSLLAGTKFRGEFEERLKGVIKELISNKEAGHDSILFIDEIHTLMGAGATGSGTVDASNLLKPALSNGLIRCLGSTTFAEYRKFIEKDHAFSRRFQKIDIKEPSNEDTYKILQGLRSKFEDHHGVKYSNKVLREAIELSDRYLMDRKFPDKAIDIIDEAGAAINLLPKNRRKSKVTVNDIENIISSLAEIPKKSVSGTDRERLKDLSSSLKLLIFGQDSTIEKLSDSILLSRSGLREIEKPMGCFLFTGPTGVGKTELSKQLSEALSIKFTRFDMSEYMEKHAVAKLIGAPPGYIGHDEGGLLTETIKKHPHCVLLLDEIEKAHPDIFNILLQVMDRGVLTDSQGRMSDFRNVILIMTTNAGAKEMEAGAIGLGATTSNVDTKRDQAIKSFFSPEFRNRLDAILHFNKLSEENIFKIVEKFLFQLEMKLSEKNVELEVTEELKNWLGKTGYDPKMGARPISRLIDHKIKRPLSQEILFGKLENGGKVKVSLRNNDVLFEFD
ncbi:MAG: ATP-dependent Clp protease ATP-binding subunit ClpA [Epsilonproteobacteria bacterium]|nr:MAG: ATP-dependent Clp protease ATP-binding subunit ClpA [Campylobacterota bacterium]RLA66913.1 MAG: ATP-dependent Clp protease ATP-binding subunit ClpA [Campylobacterota bacterium]